MSHSGEPIHLSHLKTCLWMVVALLHTGEVNLTRWLPHLLCRGQPVQSKQRRLNRLLHNSRINQQVRFMSNRDPQTAMASRKQHHKRTYQIEFTIRTYQYAAD